MREKGETMKKLMIVVVMMVVFGVVPAWAAVPQNYKIVSICRDHVYIDEATLNDELQDMTQTMRQSFCDPLLEEGWIPRQFDVEISEYVDIDGNLHMIIEMHHTFWCDDPDAACYDDGERIFTIPPWHPPFIRRGNGGWR